MKKVTLTLILMFITISMTPTQVLATTKNPIENGNTPKEVPAKVKVLLNRLDEIKAMDKSKMSSAEKKELRKEVRTIKTELKSSGNGVYLSVGAIIIIVLLLILLL